MPVDQTQSPESTQPAPLRPADAESTGSTAEGRRKSMMFAIVVGAVLLIGALAFWLYSSTYESTDDAQIDGHLNGITSRIDGEVKAVYVEENQSVKAGQLLVELDPRDYQVALEQAQAQLLMAKADLRAEDPTIPITRSASQTSLASSRSVVANAEAAVAAAEGDEAAAKSRLEEIQANNAKAQEDVARYKALVEKEEVARSEYDQVVATAKALAASVDSARASSDAAQKVVDERRAQLDQARSQMSLADVSAPNQIAISKANLQAKQADVLAKQADVDQAELNLSYCKIVSPVSGVVSKRVAEVGEHVSKGQWLLTVSDLTDLWVTANFKESELRRMRVGQRVTVSVDAYDQDFSGTVEAMPGATGSVTSLLPPENATGNYVKVVQRLPVRIRLIPGQKGFDRLRPGMSVVPKVWLK
ncbi:MAG: HlyD family secretion protein [Candidatus Acidiferrales bacterium]